MISIFKVIGHASTSVYGSCILDIKKDYLVIIRLKFYRENFATNGNRAKSYGMSLHVFVGHVFLPLTLSWSTQKPH